jgi:hypothetical protein
MTIKEKVKYLLTALDRCDRCKAQAWVIAKSKGRELYFCSHHFNIYEKGLIQWANEIVDERERLNLN